MQMVERDSNGNILSMNLFSHFTELEVRQVAASNKCCQLYTDDAVDQSSTNLDWCYTFFANNINLSLLGEEEKGGPLLYM
jgi:hypothetical protein